MAEQLLDARVAQFAAVLKQKGLHSALQLLNGNTRHRYTGVYLFEPPLLVNVCLFDRENPKVRCVSPLVLRDTYCSIVIDNGNVFRTADALADERLAGHSARTTTLAYYGFPLRDVLGKCIGTICHWDPRPRILPAGEAEFILAVAPLLSLATLRARRRGAAGRPSGAHDAGGECAQVGVDDKADDLARGLR